MSANNIDSAELVLYDNWPGRANTSFAGPQNTPAPATGPDQNVATAAFTVGTKWTATQPGSEGINGGQYTLIYLKTGTLLSTSVAAKRLVVMETVPGAATAGDIMYTVTDDPTSTPLSTGFAAVAMSTVTTGGYHGWFWCGGVCPESICLGLAGAYESDANVVVGFVRAVSDTEINFGTWSHGSALVPIGAFLATDDN